MTESSITPKKIVFAIAGAIAAVAALVLVFAAAFPYFYAESGSASYARAHRGEAILQVIGAAILFWISWQCIRRSLSPRTWVAIVGVVLAVVVVSRIANYRRAPENAQPIGANWHVVVVPQPGEIDTVFYTLYYKRGAHYERIAGQVGEYRVVPPDCVTYRGLKVVGRPIYAMCGYRTPVESYDTTVTESEMLTRARSSVPYR